MGKREEYLRICAEQVGVTENPPGSNNVKYNTAYYGFQVNDPNYAWCATAVWWCMREASCSELYYDGRKTAYVPTLYEWAKKEGLVRTEPEPGDWILFDWNENGIPDHIGTVQEVNPTTIVTLEGNVNDAYRRLIRQRNKTILCYIRPRWPEEEPAPEPKPEIVEPFVDVPKDAWYAKAVKWAADNGITAGTDATHFSPKKAVTRAELVQMLYKMDQNAK